MSDTLLEVIARLQQPGALSLAEGRRLLLDYARKRARARLGLLFLLDPTGQQLLLAEQCGSAPALPWAQDVTAALPVNGLFATALRQQGLVFCHQGENDPRALPSERALMWPGGRVLLCAVGLNATSGGAIHEQDDHAMSLGIMALCADARGSTAPLSKQAEQDILLCAALLGSYLDAQDDHRSDSRRPLTQALDAHRGHSTWGSAHPRRGTPVGERAINALAAVYEVGLAWDVDGATDERVLCQRILDVLRDGLQAAGGSLWLYTPTRERFIWRASSGNASGVAREIEDELAEAAYRLHHDVPDKRVAPRGTRVITWSPGCAIVLHLLETNGLTQDMSSTDEIVGAAAFVIEGERDISEELRLRLTYACRAAALVIRSWQHRAAERQAAIDAEHSRIARDIHDGAAQQIAQVIHMLEYIGHIAQQQPVAARQEAERARAALADSLNSLRRSIAALFPERLEQVSLDEALGELLDEFRRNNPGIEARYEHDGSAPARRWLASLEVPIYLLVQEALQNVRQHASASCVMVQLRAAPGMLVAQVSDDGIGFDIGQARRHPAGKPAHFGLRSMQERVEQAGGTFTLTSKPGAGTTIKASFPLPARAMTLTSREREVLRLLVEGASNRVIADRLSVSIETVKSHMHHIMQKLGVKDRTQAAVLAARQQWV